LSQSQDKSRKLFGRADAAASAGCGFFIFVCEFCFFFFLSLPMLQQDEAVQWLGTILVALSGVTVMHWLAADLALGQVSPHMTHLGVLAGEGGLTHPLPSDGRLRRESRVSFLVSRFRVGPPDQTCAARYTHSLIP
jgi:hypothetical protein